MHKLLYILVLIPVCILSAFCGPQNTTTINSGGTTTTVTTLSGCGSTCVTLSTSTYISTSTFVTSTITTSTTYGTTTNMGSTTTSYTSGIIIYNGESSPFVAASGWDASGSSMTQSTAAPFSSPNHLRASLNIGAWWGAAAYIPFNWSAGDWTGSVTLRFRAKANTVMNAQVGLHDTNGNDSAANHIFSLSTSYQLISVPITTIGPGVQLNLIQAIYFASEGIMSGNAVIDIDDIVLILGMPSSTGSTQSTVTTSSTTATTETTITSTSNTIPTTTITSTLTTVFTGSTVTYTTLPSATTQELDPIIIFKGNTDNCWEAGWAGFGDPATVSLCGGSGIPVALAEGNGGALDIQSTYTGGWWTATIVSGDSWPYHNLTPLGPSAQLDIRVRWTTGLIPFNVSVSDDVEAATVNISSYCTPSASYQTCSIPVSALVTAQPALDLDNIRSVSFGPVSTHAGTSRFYVDDIRFRCAGCPNDKLIKLNQLGYLPAKPKIFLYSYVSGGSPAPTGFNIRRVSDGGIAYSGSLSLKTSNDAKTGDTVYWGDFSALTTVGDYYIEVSGANQYSYEFTIGNTVYDNALRASLKYFYYNRSNLAIIEPFAEGHTRGALQSGDNAIPRLAPNQATILNVQDGWFDAGDQNKYVITGWYTIYFLCELYERYNSKFSNSTLNIPESGGAADDLLYEIKYELDWMLRMQAGDGSVYQKVWGTPHEVYNAASLDTAGFAAAMAKAYRIFKPVAVFSAYADSLLTASQNAWAWLVSNPGNLQGHNPYNDTVDGYIRLCAAAELFETTGLATFNSYFMSNYAAEMNLEGAPLTLPQTQWHRANYAFLTYVNSSQAGADSTIKNTLKGHFITLADEFQAMINLTGAYAGRTPYMVPSRYDNLAWGSNSFLLSNAHTLLMAYEWTSDLTYENAALEVLHWIFGRNPVGYSMVSGIGDNPTVIYSSIWPDTLNQSPGTMAGGITQYNHVHVSNYDYKRYESSQLYEFTEPVVDWNASLAYVISHFAVTP